MVISPQNDCTWTYHDGKLSINLTTDEGKSYLFKTRYNIEDLFVRPDSNSQFCIEDANLLTDYQDGLYEILKNESFALDLGLNAVACEKFTRPAAPTSRYFLALDRPAFEFARGDVVILYSKAGTAGYCLVLEERDADGMVRLMLLSEELILDKEQNRGYQIGMMIRVCPECIGDIYTGTNDRRVRYA
ncbi:cell division protein ZapC domain-containing protein [Succinivibrio sp.]|jgi:hypothetical protein|uniref:cell division protein ZapC domain-containing protein n=1 Tax=Succinivibrio sp. TaxID=2053619 RepID=UPI0025EA2C91|nr:cell division protein ZapC domain-containing protein [Succinivibrio sp.]MBQ9220682.1 cell division protein ZapC [Succinivibrio sp.]MDY6419474.1 cell division protein ZapC [Succinivibrio dextrinosolvens]